MNNIDDHIKYLGIGTIALNAIWILIGTLIIIFSAGTAAAASLESIGAGFLVGSVGTIVGLVFMAIGLPGVIGGWGLLQRKSWARILVMVVNGLQIASFPIGTAIAVYTFWVLTKDEAKMMMA